MPLHPILTEHPAYAAVSQQVDRVNAEYETERARHTERRARWQAEYDKALDSGAPLPPPPESNLDQLQWAASQVTSGRPERRRRAIQSHEEELRSAMAAREAELLAQVPELVAPLRAVADELQSLGHAMSHVDRATGNGDLSKAATHNLGLDEVVDVAVTGKSFLGLKRAERPEPRAESVNMSGLGGSTEWRAG